MKKLNTLPGWLQLAIVVIGGVLPIWLLFEPINRYGSWQWLAIGCRYIVIGLAMHFVLVRTKAKALEVGSFEAMLMALFIIAIVCFSIASIGAPSEEEDSGRIGTFVRYRNAYSIGLALVFAAVAGGIAAKKTRQLDCLRRARANSGDNDQPQSP